MCATCGCGKPKDKHGMKTLAAANKKFAKAKKKPTKKKESKQMCKGCGCGCSKPGCKGACKKSGKKSLSPKQKKIAGAADPKDKITGADFKALKKAKK